MSDDLFLKEILNQIKEAAERVIRRASLINSPEDFYNSEENIDKLDAICMMLIAIGESIKKFDKISDSKILIKYTEVDWKGLKGIRDIISHQYFDLNAEAVFNTCREDIPLLTETLTKIINEFEKC